MTDAVHARGRADSLVVFAACAAVFVLLGQRTIYGVDPWMDLRWVTHGQIRSPTHLLYLPLAYGAGRLGDAVGLSLHDAVRLLSAVGAAVGIAWMHAASRVLGVRRGQAAWCAAMIAATPGVLFYATVVERHAPFLGFAGFAVWCWARWVVRPQSLAAGAVFAVSVGLAYAAHSTGVLLLGLLLPLALVERRARALCLGKRAFVGTVLVSVGAVWLSGKIGVWLGLITVDGGNFAFLLQHAAAALGDPMALPVAFYQEYLLPLAALSIVWPFWMPGGATDRRLRRLCLATCGVGVYFGFSFLILGGYEERGAYVLPLAWPLAHFVSQAARPVRIAVSVVSATLALVVVWQHDTRPQAAVARSLRAESAPGSPYLFPATRPDFEMLFLEFPAWTHGADYLDLFQAAHTEGPLEHCMALVPGVVGVANQQVSAGRAVLLSAATIEFLGSPAQVEHPELGPAILAALRAAFRFEACATPGFFALVPR